MLKVNCSSGNLSYMMAIFAESTDAYGDFLLYLGGTGLSDVSTVADFNAFEMIVSPVNISQGMPRKMFIAAESGVIKSAAKTAMTGCSAALRAAS